ncbi:hypothetical protein C9I49_18410 [Pseudomonas prosekii]|uniref:Uncharacterized protein n=1 Tax=Pseudomonas prosekii TaxID=1148509 RepID=A0A2U2D5F4_9PSED|nr:hypothetical protein C9I49_18410 [Pseudomonas prosekii]
MENPEAKVLNPPATDNPVRGRVGSVAAAEVRGCVWVCSSCRACEAAFGCEAVVKPVYAVFLKHRVRRFHDCCAAERSLVPRQLLQKRTLLS